MTEVGGRKDSCEGFGSLLEEWEVHVQRIY